MQSSSSSRRSYSVPRVKSYGSVLSSHRVIQPCSSPLAVNREKFTKGDRVTFISSSGGRSTGTVIKIRPPYYSVASDGVLPLSHLLTLTAPELTRLASTEEAPVKDDEATSRAELEMTKDLRSRRRLMKMLEGKKASKNSTTREELEAQLSALDEKLAANVASIDSISQTSSVLPSSPLSSGVWMRPRVARGDSTSLPPTASLRSVLKLLHAQARHTQLRASGFRFKRAQASSHDLEEQVWTDMPPPKDSFSVAATIGSDSPSSSPHA
jgi:hypothetical protein